MIFKSWLRHPLDNKSADLFLFEETYPQQDEGIKFSITLLFIYGLNIVASVFDFVFLMYMSLNAHGFFNHSMVAHNIRAKFNAPSSSLRWYRFSLD